MSRWTYPGALPGHPDQSPEDVLRGRCKSERATQPEREQTDGDAPENTTDNPRSWIAWKRRAEAAEAREARLVEENATLAAMKNEKNREIVELLAEIDDLKDELRQARERAGS